MDLLQLSQKYGTDPTAAAKLFQKKIDYFSTSLWDMWEMRCAVERVPKGSDKDNGEDEEEEQEEEPGPSNGTGGNDEVPGSNREDGSQSTVSLKSILLIAILIGILRGI
jgi:hypothetical protein